MMKMLADIEALIDFSDEELPKNLIKNIKEQNKNIIMIIRKSIRNSSLTKPIREGFLVSVIGKPNTGKSSFINYVSGRDVSIVTSIPGTTTDSLEVPLDIDGYKFRFVDTAVIRKYKNLIEQIGIDLYRHMNGVYQNSGNQLFIRNSLINTKFTWFLVQKKF